MKRRDLLKNIALFAGVASVQPSLLIKPVEPLAKVLVTAKTGNSFITPAAMAKEALLLMNKELLA